MKIFWIFSLSALFHIVLASGSLHSLILRYHYGLSKLQIGHALFLSYLCVAVAPFAIMWLKSHVKNLWIVFSGLLFLQGFGLLLFPYPNDSFLGFILFIILIVLASINGSLFRATSIQVLPKLYKEKFYLYLMFTAALSYGSIALINSFWINGHLKLAYDFFGCLSITTAIISIWGGRTQSQKSSGISRLTMFSFWHKKELRIILAILCIAVMAANAGDMYMAFFIKESLGGQDGFVSLSWAIGVLTELPLYFISLAWLKRYSPKSLLFLAFCGIALRLAIMAWAPNMIVFLAAQCLDGFYSGVLFAVYPIFLSQFFNSQRLPFANLFAAIFYLGLGRALTGLLSSLIWNEWGLRTLFSFWAICLGGCILLGWKYNRGEFNG